MPLEEKKYDIEANNDWAKNVKGEHLYIDNAQSGRKGYFCIGCDKQMDAVIRKKNPKYRSYFRHVPVDVSKDETPCTFSNREYREILATDILQRLKTIKVPSVYKYPPKGEEGIPMLLEKAKFITAHKVKSQLTFYEDNEGAIKFGKNPEVEDRYLLIRPDVIFFDANDNPILFIELVVTHKVNEEKKIKLRRLGIDTVSVIVPKSSEQEIKDNFKTTKKVKWEYNGNEANTKYVPVSSGTSERVLEFDADQRRIFEESNACRKARLNNTLRTIKKCLQSESYRRTEYHFESEISRIETATKAERQGLDDMEARIDQEVREELAGRFQSIESEEEKLSTEEDGFKRECEDLETRYLNKRSSIEKEHSELSRGYEQQVVFGDTEDGIRSDFERRSREIREQQAVIDAEKAIIERDIEKSPVNLTKLKEQEHTNYTFKIQQIESERRAVESKIQSFGEYTIEESRRLQIEIENRRERVIAKINNRNIEGNTELSKRIKSILEVRGISDGYREKQDTYQRYKSYLELARGGTWKK